MNGSKTNAVQPELPNIVGLSHICIFVDDMEQAVAYYRMALVRYIGFRDRGMVLAGGCGGTSARRHIEDTGWLEQAYALGRSVYAAEAPRTAFEN